MSIGLASTQSTHGLGDDIELIRREQKEICQGKFVGNDSIMKRNASSELLRKMRSVRNWRGFRQVRLDFRWLH